MTIDRHRRTAARLSILIALAALAGACTGSDDAAPPSTTSTTEPSTTSTEPVTTTTEAPTTSVTTQEDVEAAVRAAHTRFMVDFFNRDERVEGPEAHLELAREILTGPVLARTEESAEARRASGERVVSPGYESNIDAVEIHGTTAKVLDCSLDRGVTYSPTGEELDSQPTEYRYRETWLVLEGDRWLVEEFLVGGDLSCDPAELQGV